MAVTEQPGKQSELAEWMRMDGKGDYPPGLENLIEIDQLYLEDDFRKLECAGLLCGCKCVKRYKIKNSSGEQLFSVKEEKNCILRQCGGPRRGLIFSVMDNDGQNVMRILRPSKCLGGQCWFAGESCCAFEVTIEAPVGKVIGYVRHEESLWKQVLGIYDEDHKRLATVRGPTFFMNCPCTADIEFPVMDLAATEEQEKPIAMCAKQWPKDWKGILLQCVVNTDTFSIRVPKEMDPKVKTTLLGATILIDFMMFEQPQVKVLGGIGMIPFILPWWS